MARYRDQGRVSDPGKVMTGILGAVLVLVNGFPLWVSALAFAHFFFLLSCFCIVALGNGGLC